MRAADVLERRATRGSRPGYAVARAVGGSLAALLIAGSAVSLVPTTLEQQASEVGSLPERITGLVVDSPRGDVVVTEIADGSPQTPSVQLATAWTLNEPQLTVEDDDGRVTLGTRCPGLNFGRCEADLEVSVPAGIPVRVVTNLGDIHVSSTGVVDARADLGDVQVRGRPTSVTASSDLGDVTLDVAAAPDDVAVTASLGDVRVVLPGGEGYAVDATTDLGDRSVQVPSDPAAPHTVTVRSSLGNVEVVPRG